MQVSISSTNIVSLFNPNHEYYTPNVPRTSNILVNIEPTNLYTAGIGWSLNTINAGAANKHHDATHGGTSKRTNNSKQRGYLAFYNKSTDFTYSARHGAPTPANTGQGYPPGPNRDPTKPPPQILNAVTSLTSSDIGARDTKWNGHSISADKYIIGVRINVTGQYKILLARHIRDPFQSNQKKIYDCKYKKHIYILIFKETASNTDIKSYLDNIGKIPHGNPILKYNLDSELTVKPGNYCRVLLDAGDKVFVYSTKKMRECIFSGIYLDSNYKITPSNLITIPNIYYPNYSQMKTILINSEPTNLYTSGIGWSFNTIHNGGSHKKHIFTDNNGNTRTTHNIWGLQIGYLIFKNYTKDFTPYTGVANKIPPNSSLPSVWPPPQIYNSVNILLNYDLTKTRIHNPGDNTYETSYTITGVIIQKSGDYKMFVARKIRDQYQSDVTSIKKMLSIYSSQQEYKKYIYILIFKNGASNKQINDYLYSTYITEPQNDRILKYPPKAGNYCTLSLDTGDTVIVYSTKKLKEIIFSGVYIEKPIYKITQENIVKIQNIFYPTYSTNSIPPHNSQPLINVNTEPTNLYTFGVGWSLNTINRGNSSHTNSYGNRVMYGAQKGYVVFNNINSPFHPFNGDVELGQPPNSSLPSLWPPPQLYNSVSILTNNVISYTTQNTSPKITGIIIQKTGYYEMLVARKIREPYRQDTIIGNYKKYIYILIFRSGTSYENIRDYFRNNNHFKHMLPDDSAILKYPPQLGNYCTALLNAGDIVFLYTIRRVKEIIFSGRYMGTTTMATLSNII